MLTITWENLSETELLAATLQSRAEHPEPVFRQAEIYLYTSVNTRFQQDGPGWVPRKREVPWPLLRRTYTLRNHVTGAGLHRLRMGPRVSQMELGTDLRYARFQQEGTFDRSTSPTRKGIAPRPFLYYDEPDINTIEDLFVDYLLG